MTDLEFAKAHLHHLLHLQELTHLLRLPQGALPRRHLQLEEQQHRHRQRALAHHRRHQQEHHHLLKAVTPVLEEHHRLPRVELLEDKQHQRQVRADSVPRLRQAQAPAQLHHLLKVELLVLGSSNTSSRSRGRYSRGRRQCPGPERQPGPAHRHW
ncbi:hypothetical protein PG988_006807 [Apiospora saccharicola]